jgi:hypothetical protein
MAKCLSLLWVSITKCLELDSLQSKEFYLAHNSGGWMVQAAWSWYPGEYHLAVSQEQVGKQKSK